MEQKLAEQLYAIPGVVDYLEVYYFYLVIYISHWVVDGIIKGQHTFLRIPKVIVHSGEICGKTGCRKSLRFNL